MSRLSLIRGGCAFVWATDEVKAEAELLLQQDEPGARDALVAFITMIEDGTLPSGRFKVMKSAKRHVVFELRLDSTNPRMRLYFVERTGRHGALTVGLLLACKPTGSLPQVRRLQNADVRTAEGRADDWEYPN